MAVGQARRALRLPRRCRVVLWGLPDGVNCEDGQVKRLLAPLVAAGFRVERVVSPCNGLAALARVKASRGEGSTCWLAINRGAWRLSSCARVSSSTRIRSHGTRPSARPAVRRGCSSAIRSFRFSRLKSKRAMAEARKAGSPVDVVVTCGNLPDLRLLTMPLIEELDVEVEPLDSLEGLVVRTGGGGEARRSRGRDSARVRGHDRARLAPLDLRPGGARAAGPRISASRP